MRSPRALCALAMTILALSACQPLRSPVFKKTLPVVTPSPQADTKSEAKPTLKAMAAASQDRVRIGVLVEVPEASVSCEGSFRVTDVGAERSETWQRGQYNITAKNGLVYFEGRPKGKKMWIRSLDPASFLETNRKGYRGDFVVIPVEGGGLTLMNDLGIDDYLKGVLPREVVVSWAEESLKVQAVASRTYMASHLGRHSSQGFDLCSDVHCQVYGGTMKEHPRTNKAVEDTNGEILVYNGKPIGAFFHSNCGGTTEQILPVWGTENRPYLPRKKCPYGTADPRYRWKISMDKGDMLDSLKKKTRVEGTELKSLHIQKKSLSGRAERITIRTDKGAFELSGNEFRLALHPEKIRSTLLTNLKGHANAVEFSGIGWGHGVGMCQWGAKGQAERGRKYQAILEFYYPHTEFKIWTRS